MNPLLYIEEDESLEPFINKINSYRHYLKEIGVFDKAVDKDSLCYTYIRACANFNDNEEIISLDNNAIKFYRDVITYWKNENWDAVYAKYKRETSKPNSVRFIARFCNDNDYLRATAQRYLITFNNIECFTNNDLATITNGQCDLLSVLDKIKFLTKKQ